MRSSLTICTLLVTLAYSFGCNQSHTITKAGSAPVDPDLSTRQQAQDVRGTVPTILPKEWKEGAYWTWKDLQTGTCERWNFVSYDNKTDTTQDWVNMTRERSLDCTDFSEEDTLEFKFSVTHGKVLVTTDGNPNSNPPREFQTVFDHFYGIQGGTIYHVAKRQMDLGVGSVYVYRTDYFPAHYFISISPDQNPELTGVLLRSKDWRLIDFNKLNFKPPYATPTPLPGPNVTPTPTPTPTATPTQK